MNHDLFNILRNRIAQDDIPGVRELLVNNRERIQAVAPDACSFVLGIFASVRSAGMADLLIENGAGVTNVSEWWAPGFGLNDFDPAVALHLIGRGASVTPHAAAAMGLREKLRELLDDTPECVHAKGGDGGRPLHFSRTVEIARLLLERGAEINPKDDDHDSTPAQWRIGDAPEVTRFLLERGAAPDIFMAAGLGDLELARKLVTDDSACTTYRIGNNNGPFPGIGFKGRGGTIYQWTLGFNQSPHEIALKRGHRELFDFLMSRTPPLHQFLVGCMLADRAMAEDLAARNPGLLGELDDDDRALLAKCCWETNLNRDAVRLMLDLGFPVDAPKFNHGYQPLHNAAWCGDPELVELLIRRGHPIDGRDPDFKSTALGWAIHSCVTAKRHPEGNFSRVVELLLKAGIPVDEGHYPSGHDGIDAVIQAHGN